MTKPTSNLTDVFLEDHQQLTRGLARLRQALQQGDVSGAVRLADELDQQVGAHMQFEEDVFYPMLAKRLGQEFTAQLYAEHAIGRETLLRIKELPSKQVDVELRKDIDRFPLRDSGPCFELPMQSCGSLGCGPAGRTTEHIG